MKYAFALLIFIFSSYGIYSQVIVSGKVLDKESKLFLSDVVITEKNSGKKIITNIDGNFNFNIPKGQPSAVFSFEHYSHEGLEIQKDIPLGEKLIQLGSIELNPKQFSNEQQTLPILDILEASDDLNEFEQSSMGLLNASRDVFQNIAAFNFSGTFFRQRGLDGRYQDVFINGLRMNKLATGRAYWTNWGGLNNVTNNQEQTIGLDPSSYGLGSFGGSTNIVMKPSSYRPGLRFSFSLADQFSYTQRVMTTYSSGINSKGFGYTISGSKRWAEQSYVPGTNYDAYSGYIGLEKQWQNHSLVLNVFGASRENAQRSSGVTELFGNPDLYYVRFNEDVPNIPRLKEDNYYNSFWGYLNGEKKSARVARVFEPMAILSHDWKIGEKIKLETNFGYQTGYNARRRLERQQVAQPSPDYYQNLPSFFVERGDFDAAQFAADRFNNDLNYRQINWGQIFNVNRNNRFTVQDEFTTGGDLTGRRSYYFISEDHYDDTQISANINLEFNANEHSNLKVGFNYRSLKSDNYRELIDLLGGDYYLDINFFGVNSDAREFNLLTPNRAAWDGDRIQYSYEINQKRWDAFFLQRYTYGNFDFFFGGQLGHTSFYRDGEFQNGSFPDNSLGKSEAVDFFDFGTKGGVTFGLGKHFFKLNGLYQQRAPRYLNSFISPRSSNLVVRNLVNEEDFGGELTHIIKSSKIKARTTLFYSINRNQTDINRFFVEGLFNDAFVNEVITGIETTHRGVEIGLEYKPFTFLKLIGGASVGEYFHSKRPNITVVNENTGQIADLGDAFVEDFYVPGTPQQAYSVGVEYRSPKFWWAGFNVNYFNDTYLDFTYANRREDVFINPENGQPFDDITEEDRSLLDQRKLPDAFMVNFNIGKSWRFERKYYISAFLTIRNVLDNQEYINGGFEQARTGNIEEIRNNLTFTPRVYHATGRTFFLNLIFSL